MKLFSIPQAIYYLVIGALLVKNETVGPSPFSDLFRTLPSPALQGIIIIGLGIIILIQNKSGLYAYIFLSLIDLTILLVPLGKKEMQYLSEGLASLAYKLIVIGMIISVLNSEEQPKTKSTKRKVEQKENPVDENQKDDHPR
ncbi:hypothetical protein pb186bvf_010180 [Paramecium bursaria]